MTLPELPPSYKDAAEQALIKSLPGRWFHGIERGDSPLLPLLEGVATALGYVRYSYDQAVEAAIPMTSRGPWLTLHLKSIGLERGSTETDERAQYRYQWEWKPTRNTREGELEALKFFLGLEPPQVRLEGDRSLGKYGEFRLVVDDRSQPWQDVDFSFIGTFISRYVTNGIIPSVDVKLQCLIYQALPAWQFYDQFPLSFNVQGPIWERRSFVRPISLPFARNLISQVSAPEWRASKDRLLQLFRDGLSDAPGSPFVYLSDEGHCPYLLADYDLELDFEPGQYLPPAPFKIDGWHFYDQFPSPRAPLVFNAPFLSVPNGPIVPKVSISLPPLNVTPQSAGAGNTNLGFQYFGLDFTRFQVAGFYPVEPIDLPVGGSSENLIAMQDGPWTLALTTGDDNWGDFPPQGTTLVGTPFTVLNPKSIWWTDATGEPRRIYPEWDTANEAVYLAMEFLLDKQEELTIREFELRLQGNRIRYQRFSLPVSDVNSGFIFLVRGHSE